MKIREIQTLANGRVVCGTERLDTEVGFAFASDLMSDVLTLMNDGVLLITGLANTQTIRTAEMADISHILFVRNKKVTDEMIKLAKENGMVLIETAYSMFRASGILYSAGLKAIF
jgi:predicted transcriptional regulator